MQSLPGRHNAKITLHSNMLPLLPTSRLSIQEFHIKIIPQPEREELASIYASLRNKVAQQDETLAIVLRNRLYVLKGTQTSHQVDVTTADGTKWVVNLDLVQNHTMDKGSLSSSVFFTRFLRMILSHMMTKNGFSELGRSSVFINPNQKKKVESLNIYQFEGFQVVINPMKELLLNPIVKLVKAETVLQFIINTYQSHKDCDRSEKRRVVEDALTGCTVMTNYGRGKNTLYRVRGINFEQSVLTPEMVQKMTLKEYYQTQHNIKVGDERQPLLIAEPKSKNSKMVILLVPELCLMVGMHPSASKAERTAVGHRTTKTPLQLFQNSARFNQMCSHDDISKFVGGDFKECKGEVLEMPSISVGKDTFRPGPDGNIKVMNKRIAPNRGLTLRILHADNVSMAREISGMVANVAKGFDCEISTSISSINQEAFKSKDFVTFLDDIHVSHLILLPRELEASYPHIKQFCEDSDLISQVLLQNTVKRSKNLFSVISKVVIQILSKNGIIVWSPKSEMRQTMDIMIVGIMEERNKQIRNLAIVSSTNKTASHFRSQLRSLDSKTTLSELVDKILIQCLKSYKFNTQKYPDEIVLLRHTTSSSADIEINHLSDLATKIESPFHIKINYILVDDKPIHRFYHKGLNGVTSPPIGTTCRFSDQQFALISQSHPNRLSKPMIYHVLKFGGLRIEELEELVYGECFNYANWTGAVQVPSCLQYCRKVLGFAKETGVKGFVRTGILSYL